MTKAQPGRVADRYMRRAATADDKNLRWASDELIKAIGQLHDVHAVLTARGPRGDEYEGRGSLVDDNAQVARADHMLQKASELLDDAAQILRVLSIK